MSEEGAAEAGNVAFVEPKPGNDLSFMWKMLLGTIRKSFPKAKQLKTRVLDQLMADNEKMSRLLMLDVREKDEFFVSTIPGAVNINPDGSDVDGVLSKIQDQIDTIVCFCSVGYRSAKMTEKIQDRLPPDGEAGNKYTVYNLEGSLFKWANEGRKMVDIHGNKTQCCHPYSVVWGKFLHSDKRKWETEGPTPAL